MVGEVSAAESNEIGLRKANLVAKARRRNPASPRDGRIQVLVPLWMDGPYIKRCMAEWGCDSADAVARIRREGG